MTVSNALYSIALVASIGWFGLAFRYLAAKVLIPREARNSPLFETTAAGVRFIGGFNAAFALLCLTLLILHLTRAPLFTADGERVVILLVLASAHFSQFAFNLPVLWAGERKDIALWPVMTGPMRFIFMMDLAQATICLSTALAVWLV